MKEETKADQDALALVREHVRAERAAGDEEAKALVETPLGEDVLAKIVASASGDAKGEGKKTRRDEIGHVHGHVHVHGRDEKAKVKRGVVVPFWTRAAIVAAPIAVAAAIFVYVGGRGDTAVQSVLPEFAITASGAKEMRGPGDPPSSTLRLRGTDGNFEILARPATSVGASRVVAYVFAIGEGEPNPVDANVEIAPEGSVRIRGRARALMGAREIRVVLAAASDGGASITRYEDALSAARTNKPDPRLRILTITLVRD